MTEQGFDTASVQGRLLFNLLGAIAEFEHDLIVARTLDGLAAARVRGRKGGRKGLLSTRVDAEIRQRYDDGKLTVSQIAETHRVSRPTVYGRWNERHRFSRSVAGPLKPGLGHPQQVGPDQGTAGSPASVNHATFPHHSEPWPAPLEIPAFAGMTRTRAPGVGNGWRKG